jgi:hypothetical protein
MAIGTTIVSSIPTVGTTVDTLEKVSSGEYQNSQEMGTVDVPLVMKLRRSTPGGLFKRFGASYKFNPMILDVSDALTHGRATIALTVDANLGSTITRDELLAKTREFLGALLQAGLLEALVDGSLE